MQVKRETTNGVTVLEISGRLDSNTSPEFEQAVFGAIQDGATRLVVDFGNLDYISSAGLRVFLKAAKELKNRSGRIVLCAMRDYVREVFDITGFADLFPITADRSSALEQV